MSAITAAIIGAGGALAGGGLSMLARSQEAGNSQAATMQALQNYLLQKRIAEQQYELSTAGRTDARGNQTKYVPGVGWTTTPTDETRGLMGASDAEQRERLTTDAVRGRGERGTAFQQRQGEGATANALLEQLKNQYEKPSLESTQGRERLAAVTGANESADNAKSAISAAALRTRGSGTPLAENLSGIDRSAVTGSRTALAQADRTAPSIYEANLGKFYENRINPYNTMATRAANIDGVPFQPENISSGVDSGMNLAANVGQQTVSRGGPSVGYGSNAIVEALMKQKVPDYGILAAGIGEKASSLYDRYTRGRSAAAPDSSDSGWQY